MDIAILKDDLCINTAVFDDINTAYDFLHGDVWPDADNVEELPDGFGIGDSFIDGVWEKAPQPEPPEPPVEPVDDLSPEEKGFLRGMFDAANKAE